MIGEIVVTIFFIFRIQTGCQKDPVFFLMSDENDGIFFKQIIGCKIGSASEPAVNGFIHVRHTIQNIASWHEPSAHKDSGDELPATTRRQTMEIPRFSVGFAWHLTLCRKQQSINAAFFKYFSIFDHPGFTTTTVFRSFPAILHKAAVPSACSRALQMVSCNCMNILNPPFAEKEGLFFFM